MAALNIVMTGIEVALAAMGLTGTITTEMVNGINNIDSTAQITNIRLNSMTTSLDNMESQIYAILSSILTAIQAIPAPITSVSSRINTLDSNIAAGFATQATALGPLSNLTGIAVSIDSISNDMSLIQISIDAMNGYIQAIAETLTLMDGHQAEGIADITGELHSDVAGIENSLASLGNHLDSLAALIAPSGAYSLGLQLAAMTVKLDNLAGLSTSLATLATATGGINSDLTNAHTDMLGIVNVMTQQLNSFAADLAAINTTLAGMGVAGIATALTTTNNVRFADIFQTDIEALTMKVNDEGFGVITNLSNINFSLGNASGILPAQTTLIRSDMDSIKTALQAIATQTDLGDPNLKTTSGIKYADLFQTVMMSTTDEIFEGSSSHSMIQATASWIRLCANTISSNI